MTDYAELHVHSAYSFLDGASMPAELVRRAAELGLGALGITDHDGLPGVVQMATAARPYGLPTVIGSEISLARQGSSLLPDAVSAPPRVGQRDPDATHLLVLAKDVDGYRRLSHAIGSAMLVTGQKGEAAFSLEALAQAGRGHWQILTGCRKGHVRRALEAETGVWGKAAAANALDLLISHFGRESVAVEITNGGAPLDRERNDVLAELAAAARVPLVATGNVHSATLEDSDLADVLAATRARASLDEINPWLPAYGSFLKSDAQMRLIHADHPGAVDAAGEMGVECAFDLALVAPNLPPFPVPDGHTEASWLVKLTEDAATVRYGPRTKNAAWKLIDHELEVIVQLGFPGYFLIVHEIVQFCYDQGIWCQGRGSAANSAVCYALGITAVDAVRHKMLFERFLSPGRSGPPDIDLDIESGRREEVIQHVYQRYGRECAAQVANVITYRPRSAIRDAARAFGYEQGQADHWSKSVEHRVMRGPSSTDPRGVDPDEQSQFKSRGGASARPGPTAVENPKLNRDGENVSQADGVGNFQATWDLDTEIPDQVREFAGRMQRLPRHLGIHSGGMVLCDRPVIDVCPVGWARMEGRTVLQWDKDDCAEAGLVKFDLLGLGMLTALRLAFTELADRGILAEDGQMLGLHNIAQDDERVYDLLCAADTVGVFQVESRAQMATLPRLRPRTFYDIVIEVALIRPGPIQGNSVNPYLNRRRGREAVSYLHPLLEPALEKTLGVPLFQEQLMQISIDAAGFSPAQADRLRKAMGAKRSHERMAQLKGELMAGMAARGITPDVGEQIYDKLHAFAEFGFPESHSFSFAYLVYASAWLKVHHPENFYAGILGAQPMGFYSPQTLIADARRHSVLILPIDVCRSFEHSSVEVAPRRIVENPHPLVDADPERGLRIGLSNVKGLGTAVDRILAAREERPFDSVADLAQRAELGAKELEALATAGALKSLGMDRKEGIWAAESLAFTGIRHGMWFQPAIPGTEVGARAPELPPMSQVEETMADLNSTGISPYTHPVDYLRPALSEEGILKIAEVIQIDVGHRVEVGGIVTHRQRPHTARGVTFISLEDETGLLNIVCSAGLWERYKKVARSSQGLVIRGMVERADDVVNFVADRIRPLSMAVTLPSRDFR